MIVYPHSAPHPLPLRQIFLNYSFFTPCCQLSICTSNSFVFPKPSIPNPVTTDPKLVPGPPFPFQTFCKHVLDVSSRAYYLTPQLRLFFCLHDVLYLFYHSFCSFIFSPFLCFSIHPALIRAIHLPNEF